MTARHRDQRLRGRREGSTRARVTQLPAALGFLATDGSINRTFSRTADAPETHSVSPQRETHGLGTALPASKALTQVLPRVRAETEARSGLKTK